MEKTCRICELSFPTSSFPLRRGKPDTWCSDCKKEYKQKYWEENKGRIASVRKKSYTKNREVYLQKCKAYYRTLDPEKVREKGWRAKLRNEFGITPEEYNLLLAAQNGVCAICEQEEKQGKRLAVDHDHSTNKIRGLLCMACNTSLGKFGDSVVMLERAIAYLQR